MIRRFLKKYPHSLWILCFVGYIAYFFFAESLVAPPDRLHIMYHPIDDAIPFCEYFVVFYYIWFPFLAIPALHMLFRDGAAFRRYVWFVAFGFTLIVTFCILYPNAQELRPDLATIGRENVFTKMIGAIYSADTNTNVCPSMHVVGSFGVLFGILDCKALRKTVWTPICGGILTVLISASAVLCKQHSIVDIFWGVIASAVLWVLVYAVFGRYADRLEARAEKRRMFLLNAAEKNS